MLSDLDISTNIRAVDPRKDILPVADLIDLCFSHQMDEDGREYLRHLRQAARNPGLIRWVQGAGERVSYPLNGFVYVIDGEVVGNCSIIPYYQANHWLYLIANVAVQPDYRRRGIGRQLTLKAMHHAQAQGATAWLQVREDNPGAHKLYLELGFEEVTRRDTWLFKPNRPVNGRLPDGVRLLKRQRADWQQQSEWLANTYSPDVTWNLPLRIDHFKPTMWDFLDNFLMDLQVTHVAISMNHQLGGVATHQRTATFADWLWLAMNPATEDTLLPYLLAACRKHAHHRNLVVNYPAGRCRPVFESSGLELMNCLIWMRAPGATKS
ncbi:MAG: GNAT family N-acetyltransferase [Anaerolineae bacterium]|jgi:ribosomal protein S18 acetylase RimI-like enzyme|nr:GNAT family N-acetyltransferase [Anaerolineae bacterium]